MKIGIVTQPLLNNYGGILQNYALQFVLKELDCEPITLDYLPPKRNLFRCMKALLGRLLLKRKNSNFLIERKKIFNDFVDAKIKKTRTIHYYSKLENLDSFDAIIVGSDQVWRPKYNNRTIKDMFLNFCVKKKNIKRIAYAASFGVDDWEYTHRQTKVCSKLARKFDAIGVRERSGEKLCEYYLGVNSTWVLDPTLLLSKADYCDLCKEIPASRNLLVAYVLNRNEKILSLCMKIAQERNLELKVLESDSDAVLTIPEWVAMFRDASYVVTDSFHGTVFSIIFNKEFRCVYNESRGNARFETLLDLYYSRKIEEMREYSLNWLRDALRSKKSQ